MSFHTAVVGSGSGGLTVAVGLAKLGKRVALIEKHLVGGDCTNVGCIPSKTLIHLGKHPRELTPVEILAEVRRRRDHLRQEETEWLEEMKGVELIRGHARFVDPHTLDVDGRKVKARNFVLSTGSRPRQLEIEGLPHERLLTNESMFDQLEAPGHLVIAGAGVIGMEMAFAFSRLGSRVTVVHRAQRVLNSAEPEVSELLEQRLLGLGIRLHLETTALRYDQTRALTLSNGAVLEKVDRVLAAVGRVPNLDLDLHRAGVRQDERGIPTDPLGRTNVAHIFAIGDVNHRSAFTHSANHQGRQLVPKLAFPFLPLRAGRFDYPSATFTDPEVAQVGPTLEELKRRYAPQLLRSHRIELKDVDRGYTMGLEEGFVLLHALALSGRLLSATVVAPNAGEMISLLTQSIQQRISMYALANLVFPYPVLSEAIKKAANEYVFGTLPRAHRDLGQWLRYGWRSR